MVKGATYHFRPSMREAVLESQLECRMNIAPPKLRRLTCDLGRCWQTAGMVARCHYEVVEGVAVFLSGIERNDEVEVAEKLLAFRPFPTRHWDVVVVAPRGNHKPRGPLYHEIDAGVVAGWSLLLCQNYCCCS